MCVTKATYGLLSWGMHAGTMGKYTPTLAGHGSALRIPQPLYAHTVPPPMVIAADNNKQVRRSLPETTDASKCVLWLVGILQ
jgi:hypothetical protein